MYKYSFEFEELLNIKSQKEDNVKNNLSKETKILDEEKNHLDYLLSLKEKELTNFNHKGKTIKISDIEIFYTYIDNLDKKIISQKNKVQIISNRVENIRQHLIEISKEKQILEKIKEESFEEYKKEVLKDEDRTNDEIVNFKYFSNSL
jgi:flagellar export protein FliJ